MEMKSDFKFDYDRTSGIAYIDPGKAERRPILMLHGLGADAESWVFQFPVLMDAGFRPIAIDLPGFGRSGLAAKRWSVKRAAKSIQVWLKEMGIDEFSLVGHSMGGTVALELALAHPMRINKLVLVNTFARLRMKYFNESRYLARRFVTLNLRGLPEQAEQVAARVFPDPSQEVWRKIAIEKISQSDPRIYRQAMLSLALFDARSRLNHLKMPTLVISSELDSTVALPIQTEMANLLPNCQQIVIKQSGHAVLIDQAEIFNRALVGFLKG